ncbi:MAG: hypothetical protein KBA61_02125 [Spirochaetes bacterium]|nr:hypothetical protein [Spirochaetota bacterium]
MMDLKAEGISNQTARTVSNMLRTEFVNIGKFTVIERNQMNAIMVEQGFQQTGCTDASCAVQIGKLMSARKILVGEVSPMGKSIIMTVRIVDVEKGISEYAAREKALSVENLDVAVEQITSKLAGQIEKTAGPVHREPERKVAQREEPRYEPPAPPAPKTMRGYYLRGIVPGWGQVYADTDTKGYLYAGAFVATGVLWTVMHLNYTDKKQAYDDLPAGTSTSEFDSAYNDYKKAGTLAYAAMALCGIAYAANWVDILFFTKPHFTASTQAQERNGVFLGFDAANRSIAGSHRLEEFYELSVGMRF